MKIIVLIYLILLSNSLALSETYIEYVKRINSIRYTIQPGETLSQILKEQGYLDLYRHGGDLDQTRWKNGLDKDVENHSLSGTEIFLPYRSNQKRIIASTETNDMPEVQNKISKSPEASLAAIQLKFGTGIYSINSKDNNNLSGQIDSKSYSTAELSYAHYWKELTFTYNLGSHQIKLDQPRSGSLSKTDFSINSFGVNIRKNLLKLFNIEVGFEYNPVIYSTGSTNGIVSIHSGQLQTYSLGVRKEIANFKKLKSDISLTYLSIPSQKVGTANYHKSSGLKAVISSEYRNKKWALISELFYHTENLKRDISTDKQKKIGVNLGIPRYWD